MIAQFIFELHPMNVSKKLSDMAISAVVYSLIIMVLSLFVAYLIAFFLRKINDEEKINNGEFACSFMLSFAFFIMLGYYITDYLNSKYILEYANGNYKYSKIMKYCIEENKEDYFDYSREWLGRINHNTVEGMVACFKWKRHISNKWEENKKAEERIEQIRKEVR